MTATPRASVVIPHLNTPALLARCLQSVTAQTLDSGTAEIIVVDNGSPAAMLEGLRADWPAVRFEVEPAPGPGLARNRGVAVARAATLAFIDADCRAAPGWLQAAVEVVETGGARTVAGGDIRIDIADPARPTPVEAFESVFAFRQRWYIETKSFSVTANLAMHRDVHAAVGPFAGIDTAEDLDWGRRAAAAGYPTRYVDAMRVFHPAREDFESLKRKWARLIGHDFAMHRAAGRPLWRWRARALTVLASAAVHGPRMFTSDRVLGLGNRLNGLGVLVRHRAWRCAEMMRLADGGAGGNLAWNRAT